MPLHPQLGPQSGSDNPVEGFTLLPEDTKLILLRVSEILKDIDFGTVLLVVQDSKVVQIEMAEKFRLR